MLRATHIETCKVKDITELNQKECRTWFREAVLTINNSHSMMEVWNMRAPVPKKPDPVPEGLHEAICYGLYDLGTQRSEEFKKSSPKLLIQWELPEVRLETEGRSLPRAISKTYGFSMHEKSNLRKDAQGWKGKSFTDEEAAVFELETLLGQPCLLRIIHKKRNGQTYAEIASIIPASKGTKRGPKNPLRRYCIVEDGDRIPEGTPDWIVNMINQGEEWKQPPPQEEEENDNIPF